MATPLQSIFSYTEYRLFLKHYVAFRKEENKNFSYKVFADKAGFKARDYILRVINNTRNLSQSGAFMLSKAMHFSEKEADYFVNLVAFNQAQTPCEKDFFFNKMSAICKYGKYQKLRQDQYEYFSQWYYSALRSILPIIDFKDDYTAIGKFLDPPLTGSHVRKAVEFLLDIELLQKDKTGKFSVSTSGLSAGDEVKSTALIQFHKQSLDLAKRALESLSSQNRDISGVTMSLSRKGFDKMKQEIQVFRKKAMCICEQDTKEDAVFQLNIQLFPLSKTANRDC